MSVAAPESYLADLNPAQREAVLTTEGPLLVVAGAGSGKTRVLTYRVAHLISRVRREAERDPRDHVHEQGRGGDARAARAACSAPTARAIWILTFHAACGRILRREAQRLGYRSNFTIYDQADQVRLVKACLEELERDPKRFVPRGIHAQISNAKNQLVAPGRVRASASRPSTTRPSPTRTSSTSGGCFASNAVDFDDMLMLTVQVLERFPEARERWQKAFRYVLVDEYQDTNHAQYRLLQLLGRASTGTSAPSATRTSRSTRSAAPTSATSSSSSATSRARSVDRARAELPLDEHDPARRERASSRNNRERKPKNLWSELGEGDPVRVIEVEDEHAEARFVAAEIAALVEEGYSGERDRGLLPDERAVARARGRARPPGRSRTR